jgi:putative membrane protein insertion efficiency factor
MNWVIKTLQRMIQLLLIGLVNLYRYGISPYFPSSCRFQPTCSAYALEALQIHGPGKGLLLTVQRIGKCHPVKFLGASSGFDPVQKKDDE